MKFSLIPQYSNTTSLNFGTVTYIRYDIKMCNIQLETVLHIALLLNDLEHFITGKNLVMDAFQWCGSR